MAYKFGFLKNKKRMSKQEPDPKKMAGFASLFRAVYRLRYTVTTCSNTILQVQTLQSISVLQDYYRIFFLDHPLRIKYFVKKLCKVTYICTVYMVQLYNNFAFKKYSELNIQTFIYVHGNEEMINTINICTF